MSKRSRRRKKRGGSAPKAPLSATETDDDVDDEDDEYEDSVVEYTGIDASIEWHGTGGRLRHGIDDTPIPAGALDEDSEPGTPGPAARLSGAAARAASATPPSGAPNRGRSPASSARTGAGGAKADTRADKDDKREAKRSADKPAHDKRADKPGARDKRGTMPPAPRARGFGDIWNDFWFAARDPRLASVIRIGFAVLVLINLAVLAPDLRLWFSEDGLVPAATGEQIINEHALSLFSFLPQTDGVLYACFGVFVAQAVLLLIGWHTRIQAIGVFVWLVTFQHRDYAIVDGEDTILRMFAFYLALCPAGWAFSLDARRRKPEAEPPAPWALRLFQLQISIIYLSSAIEKSLGTHWTGGRALYYVSRLDDAFGKWPMPAFPFESLAMIKIMTWTVLALEWTLPVLLWVKRTRKLALVIAILFHLAIDYTMNLFLFHWIMILGLLSFAELDELAFWRRKR